MADLASIRRSPLDGIALPQSADFSITAAPDAARFVLCGAPGDVTVFGPAAPDKLRASVAEERAALWLGPDEFLLMASGIEAETELDRLRPLLPAGAHSLVDVSQRQIGLVLEGRLAARCLSAGCPLDLRLLSFPVGMVARTIFLKTEIVLWRQAEDRFHVEVWRSFAPYLVGHLAEAKAGATGL